MSMSEFFRRRPPSKARAVALEKMGSYSKWRFSQEEATGRASCFLCFQSIPAGIAVRLLASSPVVMNTGDCKWLHLDCARGPGMFVETVCVPQESARRKRKRTAAGVASGSAKCKLCKDLLAPAEPYCQMFRADDLEPYGRDRRNQLSRLYVHTECAAVVKRDLNWDSRFRPYQRLLLATIESRGADCHSAGPLVLALCLSRDILHSIGEFNPANHTTHTSLALLAMRSHCALSWLQPSISRRRPPYHHAPCPHRLRGTRRRSSLMKIQAQTVVRQWRREVIRLQQLAHAQWQSLQRLSLPLSVVRLPLRVALGLALS